jgi:hypothetical protein
MLDPHPPHRGGLEEATVGVFDYEASAEEYRRRQAERAARRREGEDDDEPAGAADLAEAEVEAPAGGRAAGPPVRQGPAAQPPARKRSAGARGGRSTRGRTRPTATPAPPPSAGTALPAGLGEREAATLLDQLSERFGWSVVAIGRATVERTLGRQLSHEEWQRVRRSRWWTDGVPDAMRSGGSELLPTMLASLGIVADQDQDGEG